MSKSDSLHSGYGSSYSSGIFSTHMFCNAQEACYLGWGGPLDYRYIHFHDVSFLLPSLAYVWYSSSPKVTKGHQDTLLYIN